MINGRRAPFLFVLVLFFAVCLYGTDRVTIVPMSPVSGETFIVTYDVSSPGAAIKNAKNITAEVLLSPPNDKTPLLLESEMKRDGNIFRANFSIPNKDAVYGLLRFAADDGIDDNGEDSWDFLISGGNGKPVRYAHLVKAAALRGRPMSDFKKAKDFPESNVQLSKETSLYPDNYLAQLYKLGVSLPEIKKDDEKVQFKNEMIRLYETDTNNEYGVTLSTNYLERAGFKSLADSIRSSFIASNPKGPFAVNARLREVMTQRDPRQALALMENFLTDFADAEKSNPLVPMYVVNIFTRAGETERAMTFAESMKKADPQLCNQIAWPLIEKRTDVERAVALAKRGLDAARNTDLSAKPQDVSRRAWLKSSEQNIGGILDTYGFGLLQLGKTAEAEPVLEEAVQKTDRSDPDVNNRLLAAYTANKKFQKAVSASMEFISGNTYNEKVVEHYKSAYIKVNGSDKGFDQSLAKLKNLAKKSAVDKMMKDLVNNPAPDFELPSIDGKTVRLSSLKGKVVVVDFWATWCGPCKVSFPFLQKIYEHYKSNPKVVILALNTWERVSGDERTKTVKKFLEENKYTFPVLFDDDVVSKYGVEGIPTKFVIDQEGKIQFKSIGFDGGEKMTSELTTQLDLLLNPDFYKNK